MLEFVAGFMLSWPALVVLFVLGVLFEHADMRGLAVLVGITSAVVAYVFFSVPVTTVIYYSIAYTVVGLCWSFYRYKRYVDERIESNKNASSITKATVLSRMHPKAMLSTIVAWVMIWPFSMVDNFTSDLIDGIKYLVSSTFNKVYLSIYKSAETSLGDSKDDS